MFFYSDTQPRSGSPVNVWDMNGTAAYLRHYGNLLFLDFMARNGTRVEKHQAEKEMVICRRKLAFWEKHPKYDHAEALKGMQDLKRKWSTSNKGPNKKIA